jgi:WD40 repeat protein
VQVYKKYSGRSYFTKNFERHGKKRSYLPVLEKIILQWRKYLFLKFFLKVFFVDTLKFFLSLYGHKLPVTAMDISSDSTLIATGSADRNLKFWGLDFGDCHRQCWGSACFWASKIRIL